MKHFDIVALGECLIDFTPAGLSPAGMLLFERNPGGAPANMLVCAARLGLHTAFIGKVGADMQGQFLRQTIRDAGVDVSNLVMTEDFFTTLAFVRLNESGERSFAFARKPGADTQLTPDEPDPALLKNTAVFHVGSLSLTDEPARSATLAAVRTAKQAGALISYDPNYRPLLWESPAAAQEQIRSLLPLADLVKISDDECEIVTGYADPAAAAAYLTECGVSCTVVTTGAQGARIFTREGEAAVRGYRPEAVVDTTAAGDAFWGAFLCRLCESGKAPEQLSLDELWACGNFACAVASLCVEKRGGMPAMPSRTQAEQRCFRTHP